MEEVIIKDKLKYLIDNHPTTKFDSLDIEVVCIHCDTIFKVGKYKVFKEDGDDFEWICCANAPDCDGTAIDWIPLE